MPLNQLLAHNFELENDAKKAALLPNIQPNAPVRAVPELIIKLSHNTGNAPRGSQC